MTDIPITHMTLYKHGVGFFQRQAEVSGEQVELTFRVEEMNDVLKSLTAIDQGDGQVLSINYATPQSHEEQLAGSSVCLEDDRSLQDLLISLRGRPVRLLLDQAEAIEGRLVGIDEVPDRQPLDTSLVSVLVADTERVETVPLGRIHGIEILDGHAVGDLRFFLDAALTQEDYRRVVVHLTPGDHVLTVSYVAPAPTWRVSYRLVAEEEDTDRGWALLLGWGIFDNRLEEDLEGISLSLVAGMPISFLYDLYTPFTPDRPVVEEEARVAAAPVDFAAAVPGVPPPAPAAERTLGMGAGVGMAAMMAPPAAKDAVVARKAISREALERAAPAAATGEALGELFQYRIGTPVTVGRGQSAMVPIVSADLRYEKDLLYNGSKMPVHPVATLRLENETGLTLERGPVTVIEGGEYVGEALLPFTVEGGELVVPYAVELGVKVRMQASTARETHRLHIQGAYLHFEEWDILKCEYQLNNATAEPVRVLVEHPRSSKYDLFRAPEPVERTDEHVRFEVEVPEQGETTLEVQERRLTRRREELRKQSYKALQKYLRQGLIEHGLHDEVAELLRLWDRITENENSLAGIDKERDKIYQAQQQIQGNMGALSKTGKEGDMRARYVQRLEATEGQLEELARREAALKAETERLEQEVETKVKALG
jgi:hypothetical protein